MAYYTLGYMVYSLLLLGYKPVQRVTVLNTVGNCNTVVLEYCNIMGPPSYMRSVVDRNVVMRRIPVFTGLQTDALRLTILVLNFPPPFWGSWSESREYMERHCHLYLEPLCSKNACLLFVICGQEREIET